MRIFGFNLYFKALYFAMSEQSRVLRSCLLDLTSGGFNYLKVSDNTVSLRVVRSFLKKEIGSFPMSCGL